MLKKEVIEYLSEAKTWNRGPSSLLAELLEISNAAVTRFGDVLPVKQAIKLDKILRDSEVLKKYGLRVKPRPRFDTELY